MRMIDICVFHSRIGETLKARLEALAPGSASIRVVTDTARDPPAAEEIEVLVANTVPSGLLARCTRLRWLQLTGTGYDHILGERPASALLVSNAGDIPARAVAEFVWMGLLGLAKDAPALLRAQDRRRWSAPQGRLVAGTTLVIAGLGSIGRAVAARAAGFDVRTIALTRSGTRRGITDECYAWEDVETVLPRADHLVVALPGRPETRQLIDAARIDLLPSHAVLINIARATVIDTTAVLRALRLGRLRAALLDVHDEEPLPPEHLAWAVDNLWLTPHCAFAYPGETEDLARLVADNIHRYRRGSPLRNAIHPFAPAPRP
jgi:phosphoglycerate dehydrogenase-like enzyme